VFVTVKINPGRFQPARDTSPELSFPRRSPQLINWELSTERLFGFSVGTVGLDRSYLAEVETGKIEICLKNLEAIAQMFEIEVWQLLKLPRLRK
jgi:hypothetical protein